MIKNIKAIMLSRLHELSKHGELAKPVNTSKAPRKRVAIPVKQLGLSTGQVVRVRRHMRRKINVRYIP